jgi:hypothetical protein
VKQPDRVNTSTDVSAWRCNGGCHRGATALDDYADGKYRASGFSGGEPERRDVAVPEDRRLMIVG